MSPRDTIFINKLHLGLGGWIRRRIREVCVGGRLCSWVPELRAVLRSGILRNRWATYKLVPGWWLDIMSLTFIVWPSLNSCDIYSRVQQTMTQTQIYYWIVQLSRISFDLATKQKRLTIFVRSRRLIMVALLSIVKQSVYCNKMVTKWNSKSLFKNWTDKNFCGAVLLVQKTCSRIKYWWTTVANASLFCFS